MPRISIGLPVYNGEKFLEETLDSILSQTYEDFELIISDNASTDRTREICESYAATDNRIRYLENRENLGAVSNYNRVFKLSTGQYFKWAADDDVCAPTFLERCVEVLDREPEVVLCFSNITYINEHGEFLSRSKKDLSINAVSPADRLHRFVNCQMRSNDIFWAIFGLIRSGALQKAGLLGNYVACDQVLLVKLILMGQLYEVPESLFYRRVHPLASTVVLPRSKYRERAEWYDRKNPVSLVLPNWRLLVEDLANINQCQLDGYQKTRCYYLILRMFALRWKRLIHEMISVPIQIRERYLQ